jgi:hypothetical protein
MYRISKNLDLPLDAVTQKFGFMGRSGSGKTYGAGRFVEELLIHRAQVVIVDPVGVWWGLRLARDGKSPGFEIPIFGGFHPDEPLEFTGGHLMADVIVEHEQSLVLDVSGFTKGQQRRFVADFAEHLLFRKKQARSPLLVVWDECQDFVPQRVDGAVAVMVGNMETLIKQGRNFGIGTMLISQRPQAVNKDVLSQTEILVCFQLTGKRDRDAIDDWITDKELDHDLLRALPHLEIGHAFFWSPQWLKVLDEITFLPKRTYDASATPTFGKRDRTHSPTPIDLAHIREAMAATVERVKANDPGHLRAEIRRLQTELTKAQRNQSQAPPKIVTKEIRVINEKLLDRATNATMKAVAAIDRLHGSTGKIIDCLADVHTALTNAVKSTTPALPPAPPLPKAIVNAPSLRLVKPPMTEDAQSLGRGPLSLLQALRSRDPQPLTKVQVATLAGFSHKSGTFNSYLARVNVMGAIAKDGNLIRLTECGLHLTASCAAPKTPDEVLAMWCNNLVGKTAEMLRFLFEHPDQWYTRDELATAVGLSATSGTFNSYLARLNSNGLITKQNGTQRINQDVFT